MKSLAMYIHIPFCKSKCYYCDFLSFPKQRKDLVEEYVKYLNKEIHLYSDLMKNYSIKTIFLGGGTPSYIDEKFIFNILENVYNSFDISKLKEVTIEANPCTINEEKLKVYKELGINRISIGLQSLDDNILKNMGRSHIAKDFYNSYDLIKKYGFKNVNVDLMFGLPNQNLNHVLMTLEKIVQLDIEHISFYSLIIEEGTKYYKWLNQGEICLPEEEIERKMYHEGKKYLINRGYTHYEISNFSKENFECEHNLFYWKVKPYIGLGIGSHSNINGTRYWNSYNFNNYFRALEKNKLPIQDKEIIDKEMEMAEFLILGLRLIDGINREKFFRRFGLLPEEVYGDVFEKHRKNGLLVKDKEGIRLTNKGLDLANLVCVDLLPEKN